MVIRTKNYAKIVAKPFQYKYGAISGIGYCENLLVDNKDEYPLTRSLSRYKETSKNFINSTTAQLAM